MTGPVFAAFVGVFLGLMGFGLWRLRIERPIVKLVWNICFGIAAASGLWLLFAVGDIAFRPMLHARVTLGDCVYGSYGGTSKAMPGNSAPISSCTVRTPDGSASISGAYGRSGPVIVNYRVGRFSGKVYVESVTE